MQKSIYVLQVLTGSEEDYRKRVQRVIQRERPDWKCELWWPRRKLYIRRKGKRLKTFPPLFPGYLFVESEGISPEQLSTFRRAEGYVRILRSPSDITPLGRSDEALIRHFLSYGEVAPTSRVTFRENHRIEVLTGPLTGLEGRIVKVDKRKGRAKVKLDMYDKSFLIDLGFEVLRETVG